jgi:hypothetical protein
MADFLIGDVKQVRELQQDRLVNAHLDDGWVLLLVRAGTDVDHSPVTGQLETYAVTAYVLGWTGTDMPKPYDSYANKPAQLDNLFTEGDY